MNEVCDTIQHVRRGACVRFGPRRSSANICCWEAMRTVRIRGKFTAQRIPKLWAVCVCFFFWFFF